MEKSDKTCPNCKHYKECGCTPDCTVARCLKYNYMYPNRWSQHHCFEANILEHQSAFMALGGINSKVGIGDKLYPIGYPDEPVTIEKIQTINDDVYFTLSFNSKFGLCKVNYSRDNVLDSYTLTRLSSLKISLKKLTKWRDNKLAELVETQNEIKEVEQKIKQEEDGQLEHH